MILTIEVKPNSKETKIIAWRDAGTVKIAIKAPPVEGQANLELIKFLSDKLNIAKSLIEIKRGHAGRVKHVQLPDEVDLDQIRKGSGRYL